MIKSHFKYEVSKSDQNPVSGFHNIQPWDTSGTTQCASIVSTVAYLFRISGGSPMAMRTFLLEPQLIGSENFPTPLLVAAAT